MSAKVLIMGGTRGLGLELAKLAVAMDERVVATGTKPLLMSIWDSDKENPLFLLQDFTATGFELGFVQDLLDKKDYLPDYVFWVGGKFLKGRLADTAERANFMTRVHLTGPMNALARLHQHMVKRSRPYHLVVIGSTSSYRIRPQETIYCTVKAAKVAFTRNFAREMFQELPGSKVTMVNPGGMRTEFFAGTDIDASKLMDPRVVAGIIWCRVAEQAVPYDEFNIERGPNSEPIVVDGARQPELPI